MKIIKPIYYEKFNCIADKCDFTCCGNWEISVDVDTYEKWKTLKILGMDKLTSYVAPKDEAYIIKLGDDKKCPLLNECGLCQMVLANGEENISYTCHTFPREKREYNDRTEYGLALGCKSVIELLWENDDFEITIVDNNDANYEIPEADEEQIYFELRDFFMEILSDKERNPAVSLKIIFIVLLDIIEQLDALDFEKYNDDDSFNDKFREYERKIIKEVIEKSDIEKIALFIDEQQASEIDRFIENNELILDIMENYLKKEIYLEYIQKIADYALDFENDEYSSVKEGKLLDFEKKFTEYNEKLRMILKEEIYDSLLPAMNDIYCIAMKVEWLAIEYAVIVQWMRLMWLKEEKLSMDALKSCVAIIFRMTGYQDDDIIEYMQDSFEEPIWDYGYFDLII